MNRLQKIIFQGKEDTNLARAEAIYAKIKKNYDLALDDMRMRIKELELERDERFDFDGDNAGEKVKATDFNAVTFVNVDTKKTLEIASMKEALGIIEARYKEIFTDEG